ncbi:hypothetical protein E5S11_RS20175, partial [Escherichia coli]
NKDIPSNCTYITKKSGVVLYK